MFEDAILAAQPLRRWLADQSFHDRKMLAPIWGVTPEAAVSPNRMADAFLRPELAARLVETLTPREREALQLVQSYGGTVPAAVLEREYGRVRAHGNYPNWREYLLALEQPPEPTERLFLAGLLQRVEEYSHRIYAIPPDLLQLLPAVPARSTVLNLIAADEPPSSERAEARILERMALDIFSLGHAGALPMVPNGGIKKSGLLGLARRHDPKEKLEGVAREDQWPFLRFLRLVLQGADLLRIGTDNCLRPTHAALDWMRQPPSKRARLLLDGWRDSDYDELTMMGGLKMGWNARRVLKAARGAVLAMVAQVPDGAWVSIDQFVAEVRRANPDFARLDGDFETWAVRDRVGRSLDGFEHWMQVDGLLIQLMLVGGLHWLGLADLGYEGSRWTAFRLTPLGAAILKKLQPPPDLPEERLVVQPNFEVVATPGCLPYALFQLERIAELVSSGDAPTYRLTRKSVLAAIERGIGASEVETFLTEQSGRELPQNVGATLRTWAGDHGRVTLRSAALLETDSPEMLERIRRDKRIKFPKAEQLGSQMVALEETEAVGLAERLRKAGYGLAGDVETGKGQLSDHDLAAVLAALQFYAGACDLLGIEGDASASLRRRVGKQLLDRAANQAFQQAGAALAVLRKRVGDA
jgi:hypothetical protein